MLLPAVKMASPYHSLSIPQPALFLDGISVEVSLLQSHHFQGFTLVTLISNRHCQHIYFHELRMHDLLRDSPSSPPRDIPSGFAACGSADRADLEEAARAGNFDLLRSVAYNRAWYMGQSYCRSRTSIDSCEPSLRSLWYVYYQCARHVSHDSFEQDRWILDILRTRGRGPLTRPAPGAGIDIARTPDGTVWNDLPFLATDMTEF